ncbi:MAG: UDP-3-O-acyl-N-acetylglucosamine deacetylase, partial [Flavobacteriaceae bacterium]|nr:UDP-3-O-acyl-N-acetylglucosamine deacetylase [Flavobacteriaceae bacterium]
MLEKTVAQTTIAKEVSLTGVGLHTGAEVTMTFKPAMENTGYRFKRVDLEETPTIQAEAQYVVN